MDIELPRVTARPFERSDLARLVVPLVTAATIALAVVLRGRRAFMLVDFPLNDGGMFYAAIEDIRRAGYALPTTLSYNASGIPFAYPPLAFYLSALTHDVLGISTTDVLRLLPVLFASLIVLAYVPLARALSANPVAAAVAVFVVATQPSAYTWMVMGGGLTRALGIAFATLGLVALHRYYTRGGRGAFIAAAVLAALTLLSHIEMAWFMAFSGMLFLVFYARDRRRALIGSIGIGAVAVVATAPWWGLVIARSGVGPFIAAATTGALSNPLLDFLEFQRTDEPYFPLIAAVGLLGFATCVLRRQWAFPTWLVATALLDARSFNALSALPLGLLAGVAVTELVIPVARDRRVLAAVAVFAAVYAAFSSAKADQDLHRALLPDERAAMAWVANNTPPDATLVAVTQRFWAGDRVTEWLPTLSGRRVLDTVQGTEWLPKDRGFWHTMEAYDMAQECGSEDAGCMLGWADEYGRFDYVYIPKTLDGYMSDGTPSYCCGSLRFSLRADPAFKLVYDGPGAWIFQRMGG
jgi:hypothetical protein